MKNGNVNAMKHGMYAEMIILPNEDPEEFDALHRSLIEEYDPQGVLQERKVRSIAKNIWRERRRDRHQMEKIAPFMNPWKRADRLLKRDYAALCVLIDELQSGTPISEKDLLARLRPADVSLYSKEKEVARESYATDREWLDMVIEWLCGLAIQLNYEIVVHGAAKIGEEFYDPRFVEAELALEERIDAKIDKDTVALGRLKTMQAMGLGGGRSIRTVNDAPVKQVVAPPIQAEEPLPQVDEEEKST